MRAINSIDIGALKSDLSDLIDNPDTSAPPTDRRF